MNWLQRLFHRPYWLTERPIGMPRDVVIRHGGWRVAGEVSELVVIDPNPQMMFIDPIGPWHWWFAWTPVRSYDQRFIWLRWYRRRCMQKHQYLHGGPDFSWQYHLPEKETDGYAIG